MPQQLSFSLPGSQRQWLIVRTSTNPITATGGPLPRLSLPLEARVTDGGIEIQLLRLAYDLKLGTIIIGQGEAGPLMHLRTSEQYFAATVTCPREALPYLIDPSPPQGRVALQLALSGFLRFRHSYKPDDDRAQGLGEPGLWNLASVGEQSAQELEFQVARSDWYEQVVAPMRLGSYLITPLFLPDPAAVPSWSAALGHLSEAARALTLGNPPAVFGYCRAAVDSLPGDKTGIFAAMPEGKKRDAIDELTKRIGGYLHSGRHVVPNTGGEQSGDFPVDQRDAVFVYNITKLLLSQIFSLIFAS
jgi:hypothetical protein